MKYYKDADNVTYAVEDGQSVPEGVVEITKEQLDEVNSLYQGALFNSLPYGEKRVMEYPPIGEQLDALFHAGVFPEEMASQIQAVKNKYPK